MNEPSWKYITILAVIRVPDVVSDQPDDGKFLEDVWPANYYKVRPQFVSVFRGVSMAALEAGCEPPEPDEDTPLCRLCGKGPAHHFKHRPRHPFRPES